MTTCMTMTHYTIVIIIEQRIIEIINICICAIAFMYQSIILRHINFFTWVIFVENFEENKILFSLTFRVTSIIFLTLTILDTNYCKMRIIAKMT